MASEENSEIRQEPEGEESKENKQEELLTVATESSSQEVQKMETDITDDGGGTLDDKSKQEEAAQSPAPSASSKETVTEESIPKETVSFKVIFNKQKYDVTFPLDDKVSSLKCHIETLTSVPSSMQKIMFKGKMQDDATLREQKVLQGSKIMVIGSTVNDVMSVSAPDAKTLKEIEKQDSAASKEPMCKQKPHKTVLEKHGKPDDAMIGVKKHKEPLPPAPISGMYNKSGGKVRLTFKLAQDQLWIGTKERTEKVQMASIKAVVSEPIEGHEEYHLMGIQLGPTEASRYWVYWVPAQYVDAIKDAILGKWQTELF